MLTALLLIKVSHGGGGGEGAGRGVTSSGPGGGAAGRRNREVTFNPSGAGSEGARGLGEGERGALGRLKATGRLGLWLQGSQEILAEAWSAGGGFLLLFFLNSAPIPIWRGGAGLFAVLDEADIEFGCIIQKMFRSYCLVWGRWVDSKSNERAGFNPTCLLSGLTPHL